MALRYLGEYLAMVRFDTSTRNSLVTSGISDDQIVNYFRDGQDRLQSKLFSRYPNVFETETTFSPVANQESYTFPTDDYALNSIVSLEYSPSGLDRDYYFLTRNIINSRTNIPVSYPTQYIVSGTRLLIQPTPSTSSGTFRVVYTKQLPSLDIRRGMVSGTPGTSGGYYTTIVIAACDQSGGTSITTPDDSNLSVAEYVSFVNRHGTIIYPGVSVSSYNSGTHTITCEASTAATSVGTIVAGNYVVFGAAATTHSTLPKPQGERYLVTYATWRLLLTDNSTAAAAKEKELTAYENDIVEAFSMSDRDIPYIPYTEDFI